MQTFESWLADNHEHLKPFVAFLESHGADVERTINTLYASGYWGRKVMFPARAATSEDSEDGSNPSIFLPYEVSFHDWVVTLKQEDLSLTAEDLLQRWPRMLSRQASNLSATLAVLRAALPDALEFNRVIKRVPQLVGAAPMALQHRMMKLQMALEGNLDKYIGSAPHLLTARLDDIFANIRLVREYSRSGKEFSSYLNNNAKSLTRAPIRLASSSTAVIKALKEILPPGIDAVEIVKSKPQLLLVRSSWLSKRWNVIKEYSRKHPAWDQELSQLITNASAVPASEISGGSREHHHTHHNEVSESSSTPPKWTENLEPSEFALDDSPGDPLTDAPTKDLQLSREVFRARGAYSSVADILRIEPRRVQRLDYILEEYPEEADQLSFAATLTVALRKFQNRFPYFQEWNNRKAEEHRLQRKAVQLARAEGDEIGIEEEKQE